MWMLKEQEQSVEFRARDAMIFSSETRSSHHVLSYGGARGVLGFVAHAFTVTSHQRLRLLWPPRNLNKHNSNRNNS
jgi:hypothetical protein